MAVNDFIEELKLRVSSTSYSPIDTTDLDCDKNTIMKKIEEEKNMILKEIEQLKQDKIKRERLIREAEIEEQRYREFINNSRSGRRDSLGGGGGFLIALGIRLFAAATGCQIF